MRWRVRLLSNTQLDADELSALFDDEEAALWQYFVEGAPVQLTETICSTRHLSNGSPALQDGLGFAGETPPHLADALERGGFHVITLDEPPATVNFLVSNAEWHGTPLDDLNGIVESISFHAPVVPIKLSKNREEIKLHGLAAAQHDIEKVKICVHQYQLAFAMTDFKVQGKTLRKLILSIVTRPKNFPAVKLDGFYVLV